MAREQEFKARDKKTQRMSRDGLVETNQTTGEEVRTSQREQDIQMRQTPSFEGAPLREARSHSSRSRSQPPPSEERSQNAHQQYATHPTGTDFNAQADHAHQLQGELAAANTVSAEQAPTEPPAATYPAEDLPFQPSQPERSGRMLFDAAVPAASVRKQRSAQYSRRFTQETDSASQQAQPSSEGGSPTDSTGAEKNTVPPDSTASDSGAAPTPKKKPRLQFGEDEATPSDPLDRKIGKLTGKVQKTDDKLKKAQAALPTKKRLRTERSFDTEKGKPKRKIHFEQEIKSQQEHMKGALPSRPVKAGANAAVGLAHNKIHQVEHENVEVEAAHKGELIAESAARRGYRLHKTAPYRRVEKLSRTANRQHVKLTYQQALRDNPKLRSNRLSRFIQKQKIKRQYAKVARDSKRAAQVAKRTGTMAASAAKAVVAFAKSHPAAFGIIALVLLVLFLMITMLGSCSNMAGGVMSGVLSGSYLAEDKDIDSTEKAYTEWETDLQLQIDHVERNYPGYDEYRFDLDEIGHDPFALLAYLTAKYRDYSFGAVQGELQEIFGEQYTLEFQEEVEVRYYTNEDGEEEPYDWYILNVILTVKPLPDILALRLEAEQKEIYDTLIDTKGNRQYSLNPFAFDWLPYVTSEYGWRVHPISGAKDFHNAVDIAVPTGTPILAGHDGIVSTASYDAEGYGWYITLQGKNGISTRYAHCDALLVSVGQAVKKGEQIAKSGNTGNSTGPHLHFEVMMNGQSLNPLIFAVTGVPEVE